MSSELAELHPLNQPYRHSVDRYGWPWGENRPTQRRRLTIAVLAGIIASAILAQKFARIPHAATDFDQVWIGARLLWEGRDPYLLVGPGRLFPAEYPMLYPATSLVAALPLALLSAHGAALLFTFLSAALLTYGATRDTWHRVPMLCSAAMVDSALGAQWSPLLVAALFIPALSIFATAKPQLGIAVIIGNGSKRSLQWAATGALVFFLISLAMIPGWPQEWLKAIATADHMKIPLLQPFGFLILALLLKVRHFDALAVFAAACLPQTLMWYGFLILLAFPKSYREACVLSLISSAGYFFVHFVAESQAHTPTTGMILWAIVICTTFIPTTISILLSQKDQVDIT